MSALPQQNSRPVYTTENTASERSVWNLAIDQVAKLLQQEPEDCHQLLALDTRTIDTSVMETIGLSILQYRHTHFGKICLFDLKAPCLECLWMDPVSNRKRPKLRLIKRLLRTGPVSLQETRWHAETPETLYQNYSWTAGCNTLLASQQKEEGPLEAQLSSSLLAGVWTELRKLFLEEQCLP